MSLRCFIDGAPCGPDCMFHGPDECGHRSRYLKKKRVVGLGGWMQGRCPHRHCVHDRICTLVHGFQKRCPQWGDAPTRCKLRNGKARPG